MALSQHSPSRLKQAVPVQNTQTLWSTHALPHFQRLWPSRGPDRRPFLPTPRQGVKEFKCEVCGREFTLQANMKRHMLIHTSVRPYQCHICFKTFVQKQTLKTHMIVHSPVKPFKCKVPGRRGPGAGRRHGGRG